MRCFVIGNGPSLNKHDLSKLKDEVTFGCNRIYLKYDEMKFGVTYYFEIDSIEGEQIADEINDYLENPQTKTIYTIKRWIDIFPKEKTKIISRNVRAIRYSTTGVAMIMSAIELGFDSIYLIGMDLDYFGIENNSISLEPHIRKLKENVVDTYHFSREYWKGKDEKFIFYSFEINGMFEAFNKVAKYADVKNIKIYNAGVGGKADMFERVNYNSLFKK